MISATPALSSAPSSVSPLEVTTSWPALPASTGSCGRVEHRVVARQLDHAALVVAVHHRLDAGAGRVRARVDVGEQPDDRRAAPAPGIVAYT